MRLVAYARTSVVLAVAIVLKALHSRPNFYSVFVYFAESNAALMILSNLVLLVMGSILVGLQHLLYGPLRPIEIEQLYEKAWFAVTETCLAMTIFREELGVWFVVMFVSLLVAKVWGWIGEGRLEILEQQPPENPRLFHARLSISLLLSTIFNVWLLNYSIDTVRQTNRPNMMVMFAFEFALLNVSSLSTLARYGMTVQEALIVRDQTNTVLATRRKEIEDQRKSAREAAEAAGEPAPEEPPIEEVLADLDIDVPGWEEKSRWVFYLDLTTDFLRLLLYVTFFFVLCRLYGMPIHIIRDVALVVRSFYRRVSDFIKYRQATKDMHARYPDATEEEISSQDVCIICREGMRARPQAAAEGQAEAAPLSPLDERLRPKKLPCGHILHFACLRSWLERQQNCPTCRQPVLSNPSTNTNNQNARTPPANNQAGGAQPVAGGNQPPAQNQGQQLARMNRMRTFNLGPLRLTVGTGQIVPGPVAGANAAAVPNAQNLPNPLLAAGPQANTNITPVSVPTAAATTEATNAATIQSSFNHLERMLMQDALRLRNQNDQLNILRSMQAELNFLRTLPPGQPRTQTGLATPLNGSGTAFPPLHVSSVPQISAFGSNSTADAIRSGSASLPSGVVIPDGWTLLPLQRLSDTSNMPSTTLASMAGQTQQRSRSLGPARQPPRSMHVPPGPSNLPTVSIQSPVTVPTSVQAVAPTSAATTEIAQAPSTPPRQEALQAPNITSNNALSTSTVQPDDVPKREKATLTNEDDPTEAQGTKTGGWQWPASPDNADASSSVTSPVAATGASSGDSAPSEEAAPRSRTFTIEDVPDEGL